MTSAKSVGFDGFEEEFDCPIVTTIALPKHGHVESMPTRDLLIVLRTLLLPSIGMTDAALGRRPERNGHVYRPDRQVAFHTVADKPKAGTVGLRRATATLRGLSKASWTFFTP